MLGFLISGNVNYFRSTKKHMFPNNVPQNCALNRSSSDLLLKLFEIKKHTGKRTLLVISWLKGLAH